MKAIDTLPTDSNYTIQSSSCEVETIHTLHAIKEIILDIENDKFRAAGVSGSDCKKLKENLIEEWVNIASSYPVAVKKRKE